MGDCYDRFWRLLVVILFILESVVSVLREIRGESQRTGGQDSIIDFWLAAFVLETCSKWVLSGTDSNSFLNYNRYIHNPLQKCNQTLKYLI